MLDALRLPEPLVERLLERWPVARLATCDADGRPHLVPVVFARAGGALWSPVDGKPKGGGELARVRHVRAEPRVCLLLDHYEASWERLWWLRVDGTARVVRPPDPDRDAEARGAADALREKYAQYADDDDRGATALFRPPVTLLAVSPERVRSWCADAERAAETLGTVPR